MYAYRIQMNTVCVLVLPVEAENIGKKYKQDTL